MKVTLQIAGQAVTLAQVKRSAQQVAFTLGDAEYHFRSQHLPDGSMVLEQETQPGVWQRWVGAAWAAPKLARRVQLGGLEATISEQLAEATQADSAAPLSPPAPMPGLVQQLLVKPGDAVSKGQALAVMEAMKLQITLTAGADATVEAVLVKAGDIIAEGTLLVRLKATT